MHKKFYVREAHKVSFKRQGCYLFDDSIFSSLIVEYEGRYFDLGTGEEFELVQYYNNVILNDILENTFYVRNISPCQNATDEIFNRAIEVIRYNEYLDQLKKQKKLLVFPQRKIN